MPRYTPSDSAISLFAWSQPISNSENKSNHGKQKLQGACPVDPAEGCINFVLDESYFPGREGLDFIGPAMPFYLIRAGQRVFEKAAHSRVTRQSLLRVSKRDSLGETSESSSLNESYEIPGSKDRLRRTVLIPKSSLSHLAPSMLQSIGSPMFLKVVVDLSRCSFIPSVLNERQEDLCINIFYNGEFTHSRILLKSAVLLSQKSASFHFSGRRLGMNSEAPWIITPLGQKSDGTLKDSLINSQCFEETWHSVSKLMSTEADEWGRYGPFRTPIGEYLQNLSNLPAPQNFNSGNGRAGIIDVVIAHGQSLPVNLQSKPLRGTRRNLPTAILKGKRYAAAEEVRTKDQAWMVPIDSRLGKHDPVPTRQPTSHLIISQPHEMNSSKDINIKAPDDMYGVNFRLDSNDSLEVSTPTQHSTRSHGLRSQSSKPNEYLSPSQLRPSPSAKILEEKDKITCGMHSKVLTEMRSPTSSSNMGNSVKDSTVSTSMNYDTGYSLSDFWLPDSQQPSLSQENWVPNSICEDSVLTYTSTNLSDVSNNENLDRPFREIRSEREGVFRAHGILMGVRFVTGV